MEKDDKSYHLASKFDLLNPTNSHEFQVLLTGKNKKVLELGSASGYISKILKDNGCQVTAIEGNSKYIDELKKITDNVYCIDLDDIILQDILNDQKFDVILLGDVLEHLKNPVDILKQIKSFLNESGYIVCSIPNVAHGSIRLKLLNGIFNYTETGLLDKTHIRFYTFKTIISLLEETGFLITQLFTVKEKIHIDIDPELNSEFIPQTLINAILKDETSTTFQYVFSASPNSSVTQKIDLNFNNQKPTKILKDHIDENQIKANELELIKSSLTWKMLKKLDKFLRRS